MNELIYLYLAMLLIASFCFVVASGLEYAMIYANPLSLELKRVKKKSENSAIGIIIDNNDLFWRTITVVLYFFIIIITFAMVGICRALLHFLPNSIRLYFSHNEIVFMAAAILITVHFIIFLRRGLAKPIYKRRPENKINFFSGFILSLSTVFNPIAVGFRRLSEQILILFFNTRVNKTDPIFAGVNPNTFYKQSIMGKSIYEEMNKDFFQGAIEMSNTQARNCLTPRIEIIGIDINSSVEELRELFRTTKISKVIVYDKNLDFINGYVHHFDLLGDVANIKDIIIPIQSVPESMSGLDILQNLSKEQKSVARVVDEFGGTAGIITSEDILEEIFGSIKDEYDIDELTEKQISDNEFVFAGRHRIDYINNKYELDIVKVNSETLSGLIIEHNEGIPSAKQKIIIGRYEFEPLLVTDTRIESLKLKVLKK